MTDHNILVPEIIRKLIRESDDINAMMVNLESIIAGAIIYYVTISYGIDVSDPESIPLADSIDWSQMDTIAIESVFDAVLRRVKEVRGKGI